MTLCELCFFISLEKSVLRIILSFLNILLPKRILGWELSIRIFCLLGRDWWLFVGREWEKCDALVWVWYFFAFLPVCCQSLTIHNGYAKCNQPCCSPYSQLRVDKTSFSFRSVKVVAWSVPCPLSMPQKLSVHATKFKAFRLVSLHSLKENPIVLQACPWTTRIKASKPVQVAIKKYWL